MIGHMIISFEGSHVYYDWKSLVRSYKKYVQKNSIVLEIGASSKHKTKELAHYCKKLIGVELIPERIPKNNKNIYYQQGDWQKLTSVILPGSIDIAVSSPLIEHVPHHLKNTTKT